jgi:hypothetical protein
LDSVTDIVTFSVTVSVTDIVTERVTFIVTVSVTEHVTLCRGWCFATSVTVTLLRGAPCPRPLGLFLVPSQHRLLGYYGVIQSPVRALDPTVQGNRFDLLPCLHVARILRQAREGYVVIGEAGGRRLVPRFHP